MTERNSVEVWTVLGIYYAIIFLVVIVFHIFYLRKYRISKCDFTEDPSISSPIDEQIQTGNESVGQKAERKRIKDIVELAKLRLEFTNGRQVPVDSCKIKYEKTYGNDIKKHISRVTKRFKHNSHQEISLDLIKYCSEDFYKDYKDLRIFERKLNLDYKQTLLDVLNSKVPIGIVPPLRVVLKDGLLYSLDNKLLWLYEQADRFLIHGCKNVVVLFLVHDKLNRGKRKDIPLDIPQVHLQC